MTQRVAVSALGGQQHRAGNRRVGVHGLAEPVVKRQPEIAAMSATGFFGCGIARTTRTGVSIGRHCFQESESEDTIEYNIYWDRIDIV